MGRKFKLSVLAGVLIAATAACAPAPKANPPIAVNTTADTFDGVCDVDDCSLRDALHVASETPLAAGTIPNRVTLPTGDYSLSVNEAITIGRSTIVDGFDKARVTIDVSGSTVAAPAGILDLKATVAFNGITWTGNGNQVLGSCTAEMPPTFSIFNSSTSGLNAVAAACDVVVINSQVTGQRTAIDPFGFTATAAVIPFETATWEVRSFSVISSYLSGANTTTPAGAATLTLAKHPLRSNMAVSFTGSRVTGVGVTLAPSAGATDAAVLNSSFGLDLPGGGHAAFVAAENAKLRVVNSTFYGGGSAGALQVSGPTTIEASTFTNAGPALAAGLTAAVTVRKSVLSNPAGTACTGTGTITSLAHNAIVGAGCGAPSASDQLYMNEADLHLSELKTHSLGNSIGLHRLPSATSPLVDVIAPGTTATDPNCPTENGQARGIDARGITRPQGAGCDIGAMERREIEPSEAAPAD